MRKRNKADWVNEINKSLRDAATSYEPSRKMGPGELQGYLANLRRNTSHGTRQKPRQRNWDDQ